MSTVKAKSRQPAKLPVVVVSSQDGTIWNIPMVQIIADPDQPRKIFEPKAPSELAASIRANGLLQPVTLRRIGADAYMVIAGERLMRREAVAPGFIAYASPVQQPTQRQP